MSLLAAGIPSIPAVDFSEFGETETLKLSKIKRLTGQNLSRVWLNLPMVTYHEEADITEMEAFRNALNAEKAKGEIKNYRLDVYHQSIGCRNAAIPQL